MTLYLNARFLTQPPSGVQRYTREILTALDRRLVKESTLFDEFGSVVALHPAGCVNDPGWKRIKVRELPGGKGHIWEQGALWRASRGGVLLSLGNSGPVLHPAHILALHDANMYEIPQAFSSTYRIWHKLLRPILAHRAAALITVSRFSAAALALHLNIPHGRFEIIPNSAEHVLSGPIAHSALEDWGLKPGGFWLSVGNQSPNKNITRMVGAHKSLDGCVPPLVIAGASAPGLAGNCESNGAQYLGRVSDAELRALYRGAAGFVFPSLYEGFGIPPLEAMALGVPVMAARRGAMPDVLGSAAMWFDPLSVDDMAQTMRAFARTSPATRDSMIRAGRERAATFTWEASVDRMISILRKVHRGQFAKPNTAKMRVNEI